MQCTAACNAFRTRISSSERAMNRLWPLAAIISVTVMLPASGRAGEFRCPQCGSCRHSSVCRSVCEMREKVTYEYQLSCEPVCLPGPSEKCGKKCVPDNQCCRGYHYEVEWKPRCGCVREQRSLLKVPVTKKEPHYHCEYHRVCCACGFEEGKTPTPSPPQQTTPPPPPQQQEPLNEPEPSEKIVRYLPVAYQAPIDPRVINNGDARHVIAPLPPVR